MIPLADAVALVMCVIVVPQCLGIKLSPMLIKKTANDDDTIGAGGGEAQSPWLHSAEVPTCLPPDNLSSRHSLFPALFSSSPNKSNTRAPLVVVCMHVDDTWPPLSCIPNLKVYCAAHACQSHMIQQTAHNFLHDAHA